MKFISCVAFVLFFVACSKSGNNSKITTVKKYDSEAIVSNRNEKEETFRTSKHSPIPIGKRNLFDGLKYYPPSESYFVKAVFQKLQTPEPINIQATQSNDVRKMVRYGVFTFQIGSETCKLTAYKNADDDTLHLFVPFQDATNGLTTYHSGRYLDIDETANAKEYMLDFNSAYNPYCCYNDTFSCPLVPPENTLIVKIEAGEKVPSAH